MTGTQVPAPAKKGGPPTEWDKKWAAANANESPRVPHWQEQGLWPDAPEVWSWPALAEVGQRHDEAVEALEAAREAEDVAAEREALRALCAAVGQALDDLRLSLPGAEAAFDAARQKVSDAIPKDSDGVIPASKREEYRALVSDAREWAEAGTRAIRKVRTKVERSRFWPPGSDTTVEPLRAEVEAVLAEITDRERAEATVDAALVEGRIARDSANAWRERLLRDGAEAEQLLADLEALPEVAKANAEKANATA